LVPYFSNRNYTTLCIHYKRSVSCISLIMGLALGICTLPSIGILLSSILYSILSWNILQHYSFGNFGQILLCKMNKIKYS
jgi:hypothetical protein